MASICSAKILGLSSKKIKEAILSFKSLPHRLEFVGEFKKIKFFNDSLATIPESTINAIETLKGQVNTLIAGGYERGQDYKKLAHKVLFHKIKNLILLPDTGERISEEIRKILSQKKPKIFFVSSLKDGVKIAFEVTRKGKICLLSPAAASFNLFRDYRERGEIFKKWVKKFGREI